MHPQIVFTVVFVLMQKAPQKLIFVRERLPVPCSYFRKSFAFQKLPRVAQNVGVFTVNIYQKCQSKAVYYASPIDG